MINLIKRRTEEDFKVVSEDSDFFAACVLVDVVQSLNHSYKLISLIINAGTLLDEHNYPETGRWMSIPKRLIDLLKGDRFMVADTSWCPPDKGAIGRIDRFIIYQTQPPSVPIVHFGWKRPEGHISLGEVLEDMSDSDTYA